MPNFDSADVGSSVPMEWTQESIELFWAWERRFPSHYFSNKYRRPLTQLLRQYVRRDHRVLDYGCGLGFLSELLTRNFRVDVWATDEDLKSVQLTHERNRASRNFRSADTVDVIMSSGLRFDRVIAVELIEHLDDPQLETFYSRASRLLSPNGLLVITTPNEERLDDKQVLCPYCNHSFHRWQHLRSVNKRDLARFGIGHDLRLRTTLETDFSRRGLPGYLLRRLQLPVGRDRTIRPHLVGVYEKAGH